MDIEFFESADAFREWLAEHHETAGEVLVGFHKKHTGRPSLTWAESVDQALCFGWIDGIRRRIDDESYSIRFTPRRKGSIWSAVNIRRAGELIELGLMQPAGLRIFAERDPSKTGLYSSEAGAIALDAEYELRFREHPAAWDAFQAQAPSYRRAAIWWVMSARQEATRLRRLTTLIEDTAADRRPRPLTRPG